MEEGKFQSGGDGAQVPVSGSGKNAARSGVSRNEFGTFAGVFTPCTLTILGVIMFMRANFVVGQAGILGALLVLLVAKSITVLTSVSTSAIGSNMQVRGGGAYYLISRVLGPEFGGAIGVALFLAQAMSVPFYILGFTEALVQTFGELKPHFQTIAIVTAVLLFATTYAGANLAIKVQYIIMLILVVSIVVFMGGALRLFSFSTLSANLNSGYTLLNSESPELGNYSFWIVFAIYFPAVTGITAGLNMSGDLKDPSKSIPKGTLLAICVTVAVYVFQIIICGGAFERATLVSRPYLVLTENALFGAGFLIAAGMFAATLSSALGSYMGAPRVLQAVGRDRIMGVLRPFAKGSNKGDEPRRALILTALLTLAVLFWAGDASGGGALNLVAQVITMFFLYTYGMLNVAAFIEGASGNPSFRPQFRYFHWSAAMLGAGGCMAVALVIGRTEAAVAMAFLAGLVWYLKRSQLRSTFGDARRGFMYNAVRKNLLRLARMEDSPKNWRPTCLVFSGNPDSREKLVTYAVWLEAGRGIVFLANILIGSFEEYGPRLKTARNQLRDFCRERSIEAFPVVVVDEDLEHAITCVMQSLSIGPIRPNLAVFGWTGDADRYGAFVKQFSIAQSLQMSPVVVCEGENGFRTGPKRVDIWWRGMKNGGLMVLLAHLLTQNWEWSRTEVRLIRLVENEAGREPTRVALQELMATARVKGTADVLVSDKPFPQIFHEESQDADCILMGFEVPNEDEAEAWYRRYQELLSGMPTSILVCSVGDEDVTA